MANLNDEDSRYNIVQRRKEKAATQAEQHA